MKNITIIAVVVLLIVSVFGTANAVSNFSPVRTEVMQFAQNKTIISKGQAIAAVKRQMEGKILSARLIDSKGPPVYRVKVLLAKGRVRTVFVDASNGRVISVR